MIYPFDKLMGNLYAIDVDGKVYRLLMEMSVGHIAEDGRVLSEVYLLDYEEKIICGASMSFGEAFKSFKAGADPLEGMLLMLADEASKNVNIDLLETFKAIRKDIKEK